MNIHEYQAKELFRQYGVPVPNGRSCQTIDAAVEAGGEVFSKGSTLAVVKSQIHAGGRGKGVFIGGFKGGVQLCKTPEAVRENATQMLGSTLVTKQTGAEGRMVRTLLVEEGSKIKKEFYLAVLLDRNVSKPVMMASTLSRYAAPSTPRSIGAICMSSWNAPLPR